MTLLLVITAALAVFNTGIYVGAHLPEAAVPDQETV